MSQFTYSIYKTSRGDVVIEVRSRRRKIEIRTMPADFANAILGLGAVKCELLEKEFRHVVSRKSPDGAA